ncbi:hypothetical protein MRS76_11210 [Rhizobiaceae bacterium n13]|uniref:hypothetical protein n=1 Tax=Ferirhizobium litorale TaxID=2927786 RepID=UPI0024B289F7|nr:hypothetical protein [Fererhizobium litorale]MDI7862529.1 hypothetical protein [Fererhizobium litorale]
MVLLASDKDIQTSLQLAAQRPFQGPDPGFAARFTADMEAMQDFSNSNASHRTALEVQNEFQSRFYRESGQRLPGWVDSVNANAMDVARGQFESWKANNPNSDLVFPTPEILRERADDIAREARGRSQALSERSTGWGSALGGFAGTAAGALTDPINLMTLPFGAARSAGIIRTVLTEAAVGSSSEALIQAGTFDRKQSLDPTFSAEDALFEIGAAGAGAAVLGGGFKTIANLWHRARTNELPVATRDAGNVVMREAAVPASRFERSVRGDSAHQAAISKSLDDLARNRPVELPAEVFLEAGVRPGRVYDADGNSIGVRYEVVDASDLITSHNDDLSLNTAFPPELQPRDRSRALSQDQIASIAANLQPERLGPSADASTGAPIVGPDNFVESGNGRVMALRRAFGQDAESAANYRAYLRSQNFEIDGMANPVLIARRVTNLEEEARVGFVTAANRSAAMKLGASEQALSDARLLDADLLSRLEGADITATANQNFVRGFMGKLPRSEQGALMDADGRLSQEGVRRIDAALMGRAYGEPALLGRALEDTDNNIKAIAGALGDSAGPWSRLRDAVARGEIPAGMDITDDLMNAVRLVMKARDEGRPLTSLVNQAEMFGGPDELSKILARAMFSDADLKRPASRLKLAAFLEDFATEAMKNDAGPRLFGDPLGAPDILKSSLERVGRDDLLRVVDERLTPEAVQKIADSPETSEVAIMDAQRLRAEQAGITVDLGDGLGERSLDDILDEADEEIAAAREIEACTIGKGIDE